jgi:UDP-N-acetylglucosamine--N-acetylmuramyl-(pentapeptide) pyrophosphoryl-undecaprenol N-acetylglucosamine transferase
MKILVTGGHLTPALSFIDWVTEKQPKDRFVFVGREYSQDVLKQKSVERYELEKRKIKFVSFLAVRLGKYFFTNLLKEIPRFIKSIGQAGKIIKEEKIDVVVSFGGYLAVPFALAAFFKRIPVVTHEQTLAMGFANRLIGRFAKKVAVSFPETAEQFPKKSVVTGNPLRKGVFSKKQAKPSWFIESKKPILLVMGGNQGAKVLNELILNNLPGLIKDWTIVHQCGKPTLERNYSQAFSLVQEHLSKEDKNSIFVKEWIDDKDLFWLYRNSRVALSRSGANAVQEIAVSELPAIFVPLPSAHKNEQYKNAKWLVDRGAAILIEQPSLTKESLFSALDKLDTAEKQMRESLSSLSFPKNAAEKLYELTKEVSK